MAQNKTPARAPQRVAPPPARPASPPARQAAPPARQQAAPPAPRPQQAPAVIGPVNLPAHLQGNLDKGLDNLGSGDFEMPRIRLIQSTSDEAKDGKAKAGVFWHHLAEQELGTEIEVIPLWIDTRYILWRPLEDGGGILARADDGVHWSPSQGEWTVKIKNVGQVTWRLEHPTVSGSGLDQWGTFNPKDPESPPAATKMYNMLAFLPQFPELSPAVITLQRSSLRVGQKLFGKMRISQAPIYGQRFLMSAVMEEGQEGAYFNYAFSANGYVEDEGEFRVYEQIHKQFKAAGGVRIRDVESAQRDDGTGGAPVGGGAEGAPAY